MDKKARKRRSNLRVNWKNLATHYYSTSLRKFDLIEQLATDLGMKYPKLMMIWE
jgi:hypothetical protein